MTTQTPRLSDHIDPAAAFAYPDAPDPRQRCPHVLLNKTVARIDCGCSIEGHGITPESCPRIVYCPTHAQAPAMLAFMERLAATRGTLDIDNVNTGRNVSLRDEARAILRAVEG